jgi:hypothetical protein
MAAAGAAGVALGEACTIVLRGASSHILDEAERSLHDALCVLCQTVKDSRVVYGGGWSEMTMARAVDELAAKTPGAACTGAGCGGQAGERVASEDVRFCCVVRLSVAEGLLWRWLRICGRWRLEICLVSWKSSTLVSWSDRGV